MTVHPKPRAAGPPHERRDCRPLRIAAVWVAGLAWCVLFWTLLVVVVASLR